jgi:hypothetical protein
MHGGDWIPAGLNPIWPRRAMGYDQVLNPRSPMSLLTIVITLIVVGVLLLVINKYIPMDAKINKILNAVVVIAVIIWLLYAFGIIGHTGDIRLPEVK